MSSFWNKLAACVLALTAAVAGAAMPVEAGWEQAGTEWRYTDESGENAADGFQWIDGSWYFFDSSGTMRTGWEKEGEKWYYFSASGRMVTGWLKQGENWYYLNSSGEMTVGWKQVNGKWYYLDPASGKMRTGLLSFENAVYYLNESGVMQTGEVKVSGGIMDFGGDGRLIGTDYSYEP